LVEGTWQAAMRASGSLTLIHNERSGIDIFQNFARAGGSIVNALLVRGVPSTKSIAAQGLG
jgi:hypothetical protein